jgi:phosphate transport system substrate-binding protein
MNSLGNPADTRRRRVLATLGTGLGCGLVPWRRARAATTWPSHLPAATLRIAGTASGTAGLALLARAYTRAHPGTRVEVLPPSGDAGGIRAVIEGEADLATSHRPPTLAERARAPLDVLPYARTPFVIAVHRELGVERIAPAALAALYRDDAATFGNGRRARPVLHLSDALDTALLRSISPAVAAAFDHAATRGSRLDAGTDAHCADLIERTPGAFGPTTLALIESDRRPLRPLAIDGFPAPTPEHAASGAYPWSKAMLLVHTGSPPAAVSRFVDFACSAPARRLLAMAGCCAG